MRSHRKFTAITTSVILSLSFLTATTQSAKAASYPVTKLSGQGGAGDFSQPNGVSVGFGGEVYVADTDNFAIKKIAPNGVISVFAKGTVRDDTWTDESFCSVYVSNANEVWASNCNNTKVFRYDPNGKLIRTYSVTTPFTSNCVNCRDWRGGLVVDRKGGIYLSDEHNHVILRIDAVSGQTTVYAGKPGSPGNSNSGMGMLSLPRGLALDSKDNLYIAEGWNGLVRKVTPEGIITTVQGGIPMAQGVAVDSSDSIFVTSEHWNGAIITKIGTGRIFDDSSKTIDSNFPGGVIGQPAFIASAGLSIDSRSSARTNNIYIADTANHSIKVYSPAGSFVKKFGSEDGYGITATGTANQLFMHPSHTFPLNDGTYLILDHFSIRHLSTTGEMLKVTRLERTCEWTNGAIFTSDGTFFCAYGHQIHVRFTDGTWTTIGNALAGRADGNAADARFKNPEGMAVYKGVLYVADMGNGQIRKIDRIDGSKQFQVTTFLGTGVWAGAGDVMPRAKANFAYPTRIAIDPNGNLYIADGGSDRLYRTSVQQETDVTRVGGSIGSWPASMAADGNGVVYIASQSGKIFKVEDNKINYFAGGALGNRLGTTDSALFSRPSGLSIDRDGNLIVADRDNQQIRKISINSRSNPNTAWATAIYSPYLAAVSTSSSGLTAANDRDATAEIIRTNKTGLISRIYQAPSIAVPNRDTTGLPLCNVSRVGTVELDLENRQIFEGNGCTTGRYLLTYTGFITWPGSGEQTRTIHASSIGGVFVTVNGETVISKWNEMLRSTTWPYEKSESITLQGGKQYPIEVWYYRNQLAPQAPASLKLYMSTQPSSKASTVIIGEKFFSPAKSESEDLVEAPTSPTKPAVSINLNFINLKVRVPVNATSVILFAPEFGVTKAKPLVGKIKDGLASFEVAVSSKLAGKKGILQLVTENAVGESQPLKVPVTVPKIATKPAPKDKQVPKPQAPPTVPKVICEKGAQKRPFDGSCPPGWTRG